VDIAWHWGLMTRSAVGSPFGSPVGPQCVEQVARLLALVEREVLAGVGLDLEPHRDPHAAHVRFRDARTVWRDSGVTKFVTTWRRKRACEGDSRRTSLNMARAVKSFK